MEQELSILQAKITELHQENQTLKDHLEKFKQFAAAFKAYDSESSAAHRAAKLVDLKNMLRKLPS